MVKYSILIIMNNSNARKTTGFNTIIDKLFHLDLNKPNDIAYHFIESEITLSITYHELFNKVQTVAQHIRQHTRVGDRVLLVYPPGLDYIVSFYACLLAKVIAVPVYPPTTKELIEKLQHIIVDATPSLILSSKNITSGIKKLLILKKIDKVPLISKWISSYFKNKSVNYDWDFDKLYWLSTEELRSTEQFIVDDLPTEKDVAFLQYTSGSTGNPKGVIITHSNIMSNLDLQKKGFGLNEEDILAHWLPPYHDMGLVGAIMQPMFLGQKCILMSPIQFIKRPVSWLKMISDHRATVSGAPNFAYSLCTRTISSEEVKELDLSSWRNAFCGAEPINKRVLHKFATQFRSAGFNAQAVFPCYGLAEATLFVSGGYYDLNNNEERIDCGPIYQNVAIVNQETFLECSSNEIGEIWISGSSVSSGYWNKDAINKKLFQAKIAGRSELFFRTGDLGYCDRDHLFLTGRIKDLIIINGKNYYPTDIEEFIQEQYSQIRKGNCVAFSVTAEDTERLIIIAQINRAIPKDKQKQLALEIYQSILTKWQIDSFDVVFMCVGLPKTTSGKLQRFKAKQHYLNKKLPISFSLRDIEHEELTLPSDEEQVHPQTTNLNIQITRIQKLAEKAIGSQHSIDISRPLVEYGLNSIKAIEFLGLLEEEFKQKINASTLYNYPSITKLAEYLSQPINTPITLETPYNPVNDVAVIGMSCRLPGNVNNPEEFWSFLLNKGNGITKVPEERWDTNLFNFEDDEQPGTICSPYGGFIEHVDQFDESFFNITPIEAKQIDPQQRLALQEAWHAFENAGLTLESLAQHQVGVFIGACHNDYAELLCESGDKAISAHFGLGNALSAIAGRIAYSFGLHGPCMTVDTACSSSLAAVHLAINALKSQECTMAIAGGVNLILTPKLSIALSQAHMISREGFCKSFSDEANGYARSEGIGFVVLKPLADAIRDENLIMAVIKGSSINQDGTSNGLSAPNGIAQETLIKEALLKSKLNPDEIGYIETHGTGTKLGDSIEIDAINAVFSTPNNIREPLIIGALKSNIGHLESAAGIAGLIKTILILKNKFIPSNLHCHKINRHIDTAQTPLVFPQQNMGWENKNKRYYAGVSSFGFTGTNVHMILSDYSSPAKNLKDLPAALLCISSKNKNSLNQLKSAYITLLKDPSINLQSLCISAALRREHFKCRIACSASNKAEMIGKLEQIELQTTDQHRGKSVFLFPGQGSQYPDMGKVLYGCSTVFKDHFDQCDALTQKHANFSIIEYLTSNYPLNEPDSKVQLLLFSLEYALAKMWQSWGITPDYVAGHSLGTYAAACFSGILTLNDAIELLIIRAALLEKTQGKTLALITSVDETRDLLDRYHFSKIDIAAINSCHQTLVSGDAAEIDALNDAAKQKNIRTKMISENCAFHSSRMDFILDEFNAKAKTIRYHAAQIPLVEDLNGRIVKTLDNDFFTRQLRNTIDFVAVGSTLVQCNCTLYMEMGPKPILSGFIESIDDSPKIVLPALRKNKNDWAHTCHVLEVLFLNNYPIKWKTIYAAYPPPETFTPYYPFNPNRHWIKKEDLNQQNLLPVLDYEEQKTSQQKEAGDLWMQLPIEERNLYLEQIIKKEICYVGGLDSNNPIHLDDNFFEMGIDSLMIVQITNNLNRYIRAANILISPEKITTPSISAVIVLINQTLEEQSLS